MFYQLPPVGNPIHLSGTAQQASGLQSDFSPYQPRYFASGTAALAAAISAAIKSRAIDQPEVILPAYGCPDLVSAAVFSGARPVLVDMEPDRPWMDLEQLPAKISSRTAAIVAANLFGISEQMGQLRPIAEQAGAVLIEDSAQAFPGSRETAIWEGDLVVLSFGRGKPVGLLGGGAVLSREAAWGDLLPECTAQLDSGMGQWASFRLKVALYNQMISPWLYWLPQGLPFLHLGETRYHTLPAIDAMDSVRQSVLPANIAAYRGDDMAAQKALVDMLGELDLSAKRIIDLPRVCKTPESRRLLRYPLVVDAVDRDPLYQALKRRGLGPSGMYPAALPGIPGLERLLEGQGPFPAAEVFATRILTLPTHNGVRRGDVAKICQVLDK
jgi:dTDP-4-amino-4,6-dideoxygalactose transaminase